MVHADRLLDSGYHVCARLSAEGLVAHLCHHHKQLALRRIA